MLKAVVFDLDGVLIDSEKFASMATDKALATYGVKRDGNLNDDDTLGMSDFNIIELFNRLYKTQIPIEEYVDRKDNAFCELIKGRQVKIDGGRELIEELRHNKIKIALASSGSDKSVGCSLTEIGLKDAFSIIVTGSHVHHSKPSPEIYEVSAKKLGVKPEECVAIEDSVKGIQSAKTAGMKCVAITTSLPREQLLEADFVADFLCELSVEKLRQLFV